MAANAEQISGNHKPWGKDNQRKDPELIGGGSDKNLITQGILYLFRSRFIETGDFQRSMPRIKMKLKRIATVYFESWWMPCIIAFLVLITLLITNSTNRKNIAIIANGVLILFALSLLGILFASVWNLFKKHWGKGIVNLLMLPLLFIASVFGFSLFMFGPSDDKFADHLSIPDDIEISEPLDWQVEFQDGSEDTFQSRLLTSLLTPGNQDPSVNADVFSLVKLHKNESDILRRYLATSPSWRLFQEKGDLFTTRRWMIGSFWRYSLHGYYIRHNPYFIFNPNLPDFQSRFTLGFSGKPWSKASFKSTQMQQDQTKQLKLSVGNRMNQSHCVITAGQLIVEIFEQSKAKERRLTKAALVHVEEELRPLTMAPEWSTIQRILPSGAARRGEPTISLRNALQPGIYDSEIWVNPGEPGMIYLKAYEITREYRLSADRLKERSNEWVGWSNDTSQLFFSNTHFTIYEGDWGKPYAARFEVWFVPDSGGPERKLIEKVFKIEGWQR